MKIDEGVLEEWEGQTRSDIESLPWALDPTTEQRRVLDLIAEVRRLRDVLRFHEHQGADRRVVTWPVPGCVLCDELVAALKEGPTHE